jgi:hypothetical protein
MFHTILSLLCFFTSNHLYKSVAFVDVDYASLYSTECQENLTQVLFR